MPGWTIPEIVFVAAMIVLTSIAAYTDTRLRKIPNWLTLPFFGAGWVYQFWAHGVAGLSDGLAGFALGFGTYFLLWMIAGGGGGDTKLMGALSVWLGFRLTLSLMIVSTVLVVLEAAAAMIYTILRKGVRQFQKQYLATGKTDKNGKAVFAETERQRIRRRVLPFAIPTAMAVWLIMVADATVLKHGQIGPKLLPAQPPAPGPVNPPAVPKETAPSKPPASPVTAAQATDAAPDDPPTAPAAAPVQ